MNWIMGVPMVVMGLVALVAALAIGLIIALSKLHEARRSMVRGFPLDLPAAGDSLKLDMTELPGQLFCSRNITRVISSRHDLKEIPPETIEQLMKGEVDVPSLMGHGLSMQAVLRSDNQAEAERAMSQLVQAGINAAMDVHLENGDCTATVSVAEQDLPRAASLLGVRHLQ